MSQTTPAEHTVEIVTFKLKDTVTREKFLEASEGLDAFARQQQGFLYRSLCEASGAGEWTDILYWTDLASAQRASEQFGNSPLTKKVAECIDPNSISMQHLQIASCQTAEQPEAETA